jgi:hypothetical protein
MTSMRISNQQINNSVGNYIYKKLNIPTGGGSGGVDVIDTDTNATFYPTFVSDVGIGQTLRADKTTTPMTYNPSTNTLTVTQVNGNASTASNGITQPNTSNNTTLATTAFIQNKNTSTTVSGTADIDLTTNSCIITGTNHNLPDGSYIGQTITVMAGENCTEFPPDNSAYDSVFSSGQLNDISHYNGDIYAAGTIYNLTNATNIAKYNIATNTWSALGTGANGTVYRIVISPTGVVYALGAFTSMGGVANTAGIAKWDGSAWSAIGTGLSGGTGFDLAFNPTDETKFIVCGSFTLAGGVANTARVAYWNGAAYVPIGTGANSNQVFSATWSDSDTVYISGNYGTLNGVANTTGVAKYVLSTNTVSSIGTIAGLSSSTDAYNCVYWDSVTNSVIFGGGQTTINSDTTLRGVVKYTPSSGVWSLVGTYQTDAGYFFKRIKRLNGILYFGIASQNSISLYSSNPSTYTSAIFSTPTFFFFLNPTTNLLSPKLYTPANCTAFDMDASGNLWITFNLGSNQNRLYSVNLNKIKTLNTSSKIISQITTTTTLLPLNLNTTYLYPQLQYIYSSVFFANNRSYISLMWDGSYWRTISSNGVSLSYINPTI